MVMITRQYEDDVLIESLRDRQGFQPGQGNISKLKVSDTGRNQVEIAVTVKYYVDSSEVLSYTGDPIFPPPPE